MQVQSVAVVAATVIDTPESTLSSVIHGKTEWNGTRGGHTPVPIIVVREK